MELADFITARLDEDEVAAMAATGTAWAWEATGDKDNSWAVGHVDDEDGRPLSGQIEHGQGVVIDGVCESINGNLADAAHIARHDPARVLREVAAKRAIVADHAASPGHFGPSKGEPCCSSCGAVFDDPYLFTPWPCDTVKAIASVWSDHPDYRAEWAG